MHAPRHLLLLAAVACCCAPAARSLAGDGWLATVGITLDPPDGDQQVVSLVLRPERSFTYERLNFECVYRQEISWTDERNRPVRKVIEPVSFTYRRSNVKLVAELDYYCNFRAPFGYARLTHAYGTNIFAAGGGPIVIDRLRISGEAGGKTLWQHEFKAPGNHAVRPPKPPPPPPPPPRSTTFGEVNLD